MNTTERILQEAALNKALRDAVESLPILYDSGWDFWGHANKVIKNVLEEYSTMKEDGKEVTKPTYWNPIWGDYGSFANIEIPPDFNEKRTDVIGQNGNDGLHYSATDQQIGGSHYKDAKIQPIEFITKNNIPYREANIIKYVFRYRNKNGLEDLKKARHYIDMLIEEYV